MIDSRILDLWGVSKESDLVEKLVTTKKLTITGISSDLGKCFFLKRLFLTDFLSERIRSVYWFEGNTGEEFKYSVFIKELFDNVETINFKEFTTNFPVLAQQIFIWSWEGFLKNILTSTKLFVFMAENPVTEFVNTSSIFKLIKGSRYPLIIICDE